MATTVFNLEILPCRHFIGLKRICSLPVQDRIVNVFNEHHGLQNAKSKFTNTGPSDTKCQENVCSVVGSSSTGISNAKDLPEIESHMFIADLAQFGIKSLLIRCNEVNESSFLEDVISEATNKASNAFELLMANGRKFPSKKTDVENAVSQLSEAGPTLPLTAQTARGVVNCVEFEKPRVYYSKTKLSSRQNILLAIAVSESDYTCGSPLSAHELLKNVYIWTALSSSSRVEFSYYSSDLGRNDICSYCGANDACVDVEMKKSFKTVLPICNTCKNAGKIPVTMRPY